MLLNSTIAMNGALVTKLQAKVPGEGFAVQSIRDCGRFVTHFASRSGDFLKGAQGMFMQLGSMVRWTQQPRGETRRTGPLAVLTSPRKQRAAKVMQTGKPQRNLTLFPGMAMKAVPSRSPTRSAAYRLSSRPIR